MKPSNLTRLTFNLSTRTLPYARLRDYVCNNCGGGMAHKFVWDEEAQATVDKVECGACGGDDLVSERHYLEQISDGWEVAQGLPPALQALMKGSTQCQSATEAIDDLFDKA